MYVAINYSLVQDIQCRRDVSPGCSHGIFPRYSPFSDALAKRIDILFQFREEGISDRIGRRLPARIGGSSLIKGLANAHKEIEIRRALRACGRLSHLYT